MNWQRLTMSANFAVCEPAMLLDGDAARPDDATTAADAVE